MANKKRLIDIDALGIGRCNPDLLPFCNRPYAAGWNGVVNLIENAPTVDAVEVIRCNDCKKRDTNLCPLYHCVSPMITSMDDDFCSHGERKTDG